MREQVEIENTLYHINIEGHDVTITNGITVDDLGTLTKSAHPSPAPWHATASTGHTNTKTREDALAFLIRQYLTN